MIRRWFNWVWQQISQLLENTATTEEVIESVETVWRITTRDGRKYLFHSQNRVTVFAGYYDEAPESVQKAADAVQARTATTRQLMDDAFDELRAAV